MKNEDLSLQAPLLDKGRERKAKERRLYYARNVLSCFVWPVVCTHRRRTVTKGMLYICIVHKHQIHIDTISNNLFFSKFKDCNEWLVTFAAKFHITYIVDFSLETIVFWTISKRNPLWTWLNITYEIKRKITNGQSQILRYYYFVVEDHIGVITESLL